MPNNFLGHGNERISIQKGKDRKILSELDVKEPLNPTGARKFVVEVTTSGEIRVFWEDDLFKPIISAFDPEPFEINYFSLDTDRSGYIRFYYDCRPFSHNEEVIEEIFATKTDKTTLNDQCAQYAASKKEFTESPFELRDIALKPYQRENYTVRGNIFVVYVANAIDASIVFASKAHPDPHNDTVYELRKISLRRRIGD